MQIPGKQEYNNYNGCIFFLRRSLICRLRWGHQPDTLRYKLHIQSIGHHRPERYDPPCVPCSSEGVGFWMVIPLHEKLICDDNSVFSFFWCVEIRFLCNNYWFIFLFLTNFMQWKWYWLFFYYFRWWVEDPLISDGIIFYW